MAEASLDARGLRCPLPVLKLEKRLDSVAVGDTLIVLATDPMARVDIPLYCIRNNHTCDIAKENGVLRFTIARRALVGRDVIGGLR